MKSKTVTIAENFFCPCRREMAAEFFGTLTLVFFGVGAVNAAVLTGAQSGLWQVAVVWSVAVGMAIYCTGAISGAHLNPAITLSFFVWRKFPANRVLPYIAGQLAGAMTASIILYTLFAGPIQAFETRRGIIRGTPESVVSAMVFGEYFPNPAIAASLGWNDSTVTHRTAMIAEGVGTFFLALMIFGLTDKNNSSSPGQYLTPLSIGLTVAMIISVIAPLTQAGLNPARDLGPRIIAWAAGWGHVAIPGPRGGFFTVYILAPIIGALMAGYVWKFISAIVINKFIDISEVSEISKISEVSEISNQLKNE
ncbi:MAG: aquaporin [Candidatus Wallbacteria bacterium HGW-Wallbacteria-1]|jgi:glycerol uptake facilitator protein|uniref:Aquaporin n=1 Tax=Candidatus Wallbacteria bacterium HGW-Wallbacteria-1 TaxID=2013854 RepID=A0A2N1PM10_9BACT|nr:MAG: aquaporin [Candidatus Wallbacteria bacterium HGW-Wallbacteria-1]